MYKERPRSIYREGQVSHSDQRTGTETAIAGGMGKREHQSMTTARLGDTKQIGKVTADG